MDLLKICRNTSAKLLVHKMTDGINSQKLNPHNRFLANFVKFKALENFALYGIVQDYWPNFTKNDKERLLHCINFLTDIHVFIFGRKFELIPISSLDLNEF